MITAPDSRYVHASTQAAHAQQEYLIAEAKQDVMQRERRHVRRFDLRTDWGIILGILALLAFMAILVLLVR